MWSRIVLIGAFIAVMLGMAGWEPWKALAAGMGFAFLMMGLGVATTASMLNPDDRARFLKSLSPFAKGSDGEDGKG